MPGRRHVKSFILAAIIAPLAVGVGSLFLKREPSEGVTVGKAKVAAPAPDPLPQDKSVAVIPFENAEGETDALLADGLQEGILQRLRLVHEVRLVSESSVESYRGTSKAAAELGRELNVAYILEGSVRRMGDRLHITVSLFDASKEQIWSESYDPDVTPTALYAVEATVTEAVASAIKVTVTAGERAFIARTSTAKMPAYEAFLRAREVRRMPRPLVGSPDPLRLLATAVELDPAFVEAWLEIARINLGEYTSYRDHSAGRLANARAATDASVALAPELADVIAVRAAYDLEASGEFEAAVEQYTRLEELEPHNAAHFRGFANIREREGKPVEAIALRRIAVAFDPSNLPAVLELAETYRAGRLYAEALVERRGLMLRLKAAGRLEDDVLAMQLGFEQAYLFFEAAGSWQEAETFLTEVKTATLLQPAGLELRRRWAAATGDLPEVLRLDAARFPKGDLSVEAAFARAASGDREGAQRGLEVRAAEVQARLAAEPENDLLWAEWGMIEAIRNHPEEATRAAQRAVDLMPESRDARRGAARAYSAAVVAAWTGDTDRALAELARLLLVPGATPGVYVLAKAPELFPLHAAARFKALLDLPANSAQLFKVP